MTHQPRHALPVLQVLLLLCLLLVTNGCRPGESVTEAPGGLSAPDKSSRPTPDDALARMIRTYQEAAVYSDRGEIVLTFRSGGSLRRDVAPLRIAYQRPGRLKMEAYQVRLASDGERLQARIEDEASSHLDNQVVVREMPPQLTLPWLLEDSLLHEVLQQGLGRQPIQLELLLGSNPITPFLAPGVQRHYLDDQTLHGRRCHRLRIDMAEGPFVFWIDQQDWLLRRLEYPTAGLRTTAESRAMVTDMKLVADFHDARLAATGDRFRTDDLRQLEGVRIVRRFVRPPQPLPTNLFAEQLPGFRLERVGSVTSGTGVESRDDGRANEGIGKEPSRYFESEEMRERVVVLHWYVDHPACQASLERLENLRRRWEQRSANKNQARQLGQLTASGSETEVDLEALGPEALGPEIQDHEVQVSFHAVSADAPSTPTEVIKSRMREWGFELPILRDREAVGRDVFDIQALPTVVVLGTDGTVQLFESTFNPLLDVHLEEALERTLAGEDLGLSVIAQAHHDALHYQQQLIAAAPLEDRARSAASTSVTPATEPARLKLRQLWRNEGISDPGNLVLATGPDGRPRIYVLQGGTEVIELDERGTILGRHPLPVQQDEQITLLRTTGGEESNGGVGSTRYFVAAEWGGQRLHLLDHQLRRTWTAPPPELRHEGVLDVKLVDWSGDGRPEVCVLLAGVGLMAWDLEGNEVVRIPTLPGVSLVAAPRIPWSTSDVALEAPSDEIHEEAMVAERILYVATEHGRIADVATRGAPEAVRPHPPLAIFSLFGRGHAAGLSGSSSSESGISGSGTSGSGTSHYVGVSHDQRGDRLALGLTKDLETIWSYRLPGGAHDRPVDWGVYLPWLNDGEGGWCFVSPDGAVHFVGEDGEFHDYFYPGKSIRGVGGAIWEVKGVERGVLLLATEGGLEVWVEHRP